MVKRNKFEPKSMFTIFFRSTGAVFVDCLSNGKTIHEKNCRDNCLKPVLQKVREERAGAKNIKVLHDNANPHVDKVVKTYLENEDIKTIDHPPYSPDLAPCDF